MSAHGSGDSEKPSAGTAVDGVDATAVQPQGWERRSSERIEVLWSVDCETEDTFLYAAITNISEMGIFVRTEEPLAVGTSVTLRFAPPLAKGRIWQVGPIELGHDGAASSPKPRAPPEPFVLDGVVQWVNRVRPREDNPNPGMGIRFARLTLADRERIVEAIHTIAYLREEPRAAEGAGRGAGN
jgi:type IV pilus assembly protein PilZ